MRNKSRDLEHHEQAALIAWSELNLVKYPQLKWLFAVPNGGHRHKSVAAKLKKEGVKPGVPDLLLPVPSINMEYIGLAIEMKAKNGRTSPGQKEWLTGLQSNGWKTAVCYSWIEAKQVIEDYLS